MTLVLPNSIDNATAADAVEVQQNFQTITQYVNTQMIHRDGSVAMTAPLLLSGNPTEDLQAATKLYVDALLPVGIMVPFAGVSPPSGKWMLCNGASLATASYPLLFAQCGYRYGGSGANFNIPNMDGRFPVGVNAADTDFDVTGETGGTKLAQLVAHTHTINHGHTASSGSAGSHSHNTSHTADHTHSTGSGGAHSHSVSDPGHAHNIVVRHDPISGSAGSIAVSNAGGTLSTRASNAAATGISVATSATHTHTVTAGGGHSHSTDAAANHTHTVSVTSHSGASGSTGTADVKQLPPYIVLSYIIRVD